MADLILDEQLETVQRQIQERALRLADLEMIIHDYHLERQRLLQEIIELRQQFWDLTDCSQEPLPRDS